MTKNKYKTKDLSNYCSIESPYKKFKLSIEDEKYRDTIDQKLGEYLDNLEENNYLDLWDCDRADVKELCLTYVDRLFKKYFNTGKAVYTTIPCKYKNSSYISSGVLFYVLEIHYEMDSSKVTQKRYREIFKDRIHSSSFNTTLKFLQKEIFEINAPFYKEKVLTYSKKYIEMLKRYYKLEINFNDYILKIKKFFNQIINNKIFCRATWTIQEQQRRIELKHLLEEKGFEINLLYKRTYYQYFLPHYLALFLVYVALIKESKRETVKSFSLKAICKYFNLSNYKATVIKDLLLNTLETCSEDLLPGFRYDKSKFSRRLNLLWKKTNRIEVKMVLSLFEILRIEIKEFIENVISFNSKRDAGKVIHRLKEHDFSFLHYRAIQKNIKKLMKLKKITKNQYESSMNLIRSVLDDKLRLYNPTKNGNIRSKTLKHDSIFYRFKFLEENISRIKNKILQKKFRDLTDKIMNNEYPMELFNNKGIRCSDFYIEGTRKERIETKTIKSQLVKPLIKKERMYYNGRIAEELHKITKHVINEYKTTSHEPVLTHLLMEMKQLNILSVETPVWHKEVTGHIDLLGELDDSLIIIEYKPKEYELYKGLTQPCVYTYILAKLLDIEMENIKCLIFTPYIALTYESTVLYKIIEFIQGQNSKREKRLTLKNNKPYDIENELLNLLDLEQ